MIFYMETPTRKKQWVISLRPIETKHYVKEVTRTHRTFFQLELNLGIAMVLSTYHRSPSPYLNHPHFDASQSAAIGNGE